MRTLADAAKVGLYSSVEATQFADSSSRDKHQTNPEPNLDNHIVSATIWFQTRSPKIIGPHRISAQAIPYQQSPSVSTERPGELSSDEAEEIGCRLQDPTSSLSLTMAMSRRTKKDSRRGTKAFEIGDLLAKMTGEQKANLHKGQAAT